MIEARIDLKTEEITVRFSGPVMDLCAEMGYLVGHVYCRIKEKDAKAAAGMRALMAELMALDSPAWTSEYDF